MASSVFVVGMPRSGTTLLSEMLSAHPDVAIAPETRYYLRYAPDCERRDCLSDPETARRFVDHFLDDWVRPNLDLDDEAVDVVRDAILDDLSSHRDVLAPVLRAHAEAEGATVPGEKTPAHLTRVPWILEDFPDAQVLSIVRDPRDVHLSLRRTSWGPDSPVRNGRRWRRYAHLTEEYLDRYPERFGLVRYEDLLEEPEGVARTILDRLGVGWDPAVAAFHQGEAETFDVEDEPHKSKAREPIDPSNRAKWRDQMEEGTRKVFDVLAEEEMRWYGYRPSDVDWSPSSAGTVAQRFLRFSVAWARHQARWIYEDKIADPDFVSET